MAKGKSFTNIETSTADEIKPQISGTTVKYTGGADIDGLYDSDQAARLLNVSKHTFQNYLRSGLIPATKINKKWRVTPDTIDRFRRGEFTVNVPGSAFFRPAVYHKKKELDREDYRIIERLILSRIADIARERAEKGDANFNADENKSLNSILAKLNNRNSIDANNET